MLGLSLAMLSLIDRPACWYQPFCMLGEVLTSLVPLTFSLWVSVLSYSCYRYLYGKIQAIALAAEVANVDLQLYLNRR